MANIGQKIKEQRTMLGLTQDELAQRLGYKTRSSIARIESGENDIPRSKIAAFAKVLNVPQSFFFSEEDILDIVNALDKDILEKYGSDLSVAVAEQKKRDDEQSKKDAHILLHTKPIKENPFEPEIDIVSNINQIYKKIYRVPVFESVSAGFGALAENEIVDYIPVVIENPCDVKDTIAIKVTGDSMYPKIEDGDIIIVRKQESVDSGDIAVLLLDDNEGLVKRVVYGDTWIELHSINPEYKTRRFDEADVLRLRVVGKVIGSYKVF